MTTAEWVVLVLMILLVGVLVTAVWRLERRQREWEWLHPPEEDGDGVYLLKEEKKDGHLL